jgi:hypothetical protein
MAYADRLIYTALLLAEAAASADYNDYREVDVLLTRSDVDADWRQVLEHNIAAARLLADVGTGERIFLNEPESRRP